MIFLPPALALDGGMELRVELGNIQSGGEHTHWACTGNGAELYPKLGGEQLFDHPHPRLGEITAVIAPATER